MKIQKAPPPVSDINVTPMVDVMLVMLIIFMVITLMLSKGVSVDLVKTKNPIAMQSADKEDAVMVAVTMHVAAAIVAVTMRIAAAIVAGITPMAADCWNM